VGRYPFSTETDIDSTHTQLEDMFGRRPRPQLAVNFPDEFPRFQNQQWRVSCTVANNGRAAARDVCISFPFRSGMTAIQLDPNWKLVSGTSDSHGAIRTTTFQLTEQQVIHPGVAMEFAGGLILNFQQNDEFRPGASIEIKCVVYCDGAAPTGFQQFVTLAPK
jgi:hypothetical protein